MVIKSNYWISFFKKLIFSLK